MVRLVLCHVRECRQPVIDRERERDRDNRKDRKNIEQNTYATHRSPLSTYSTCKVTISDESIVCVDS